MGSGDVFSGVESSSDDAWRLADRVLCDAVLEVSSQIAVLEARRVRLVAEVDAHCRMDVLGYRNTKMWLGHTTLLEVGAAGRLISLGAVLGKYPSVGAALDAGEVSIAVAGLIVGFCENPPAGMPADALPACVDALLVAGRGPLATAPGVRAVIAKLERIFESDTPPPAEDTDRNEFHACRTLNGRVAVKADLDAVSGEMLLSALSGLCAPRPATDGTKDSRSPAKRRADGFTELLRRYLAAGAGPSEGGVKPHLSVMVKAADLASHPKPAPDSSAADSHRDLLSDPEHDHVGWASWMGPLTISTTRMLACDCLLSAVVVDPDGAPLDVGATVRTVTAKQRRALAVRDGGCAFPNCGAPVSWCEGHHIVHWADHGPTNLNNLVLLCGFHHRLIHHSRWEVIMGGDRYPWFLPPPLPGERPVLPSNRRTGHEHTRAGPDAD
ncbi:DUF222 domain-containing protein [Rhodococcus sp. NPDC058521]|uniref:HNH endonuclease signature motif containing protein n=1 Tax=Rhodococcus sp. NPDC058521 TaxID=3346536 RepID=UPI00366867E7